MIDAAPKKKDWDKIVSEVTKDEKNLDGEDGLTKLFKDIYGNASDEQRRAMMKSYVIGSIAFFY